MEKCHICNTEFKDTRWALLDEHNNRIDTMQAKMIQSLKLGNVYLGEMRTCQNNHEIGKLEKIYV